MTFITQKKEKKTIQDIIFNHLDKILELSCNEFRGGYTQKKVVNGIIEEIYVPDSRKRMIQAIEFFSYILEPFFDEPSKTKHKVIMVELKKNLEAFEKEKEPKPLEDFVITKLKLMMQVFRMLNQLLNKLNYLKTATYVEDEDDEEEVEEKLNKND